MPEKKTVKIYHGKEKDAPLVVLNTVEGEGETVYCKAREMTDADFSLAAIGGINWDSEMTPWEAPAAFRGGSGFGGKADGYIRELKNEILPHIADEIGGEPRLKVIAGYSLGGLFAVYSLFRTDVFSRAVSGSGSFWFPGFVDFAAATPLAAAVDKVYFSLGNREASTRNPVMRGVQSCTESLVEIFRKKGTAATFVLNEGNHFFQTEERMAKGIAEILGEVVKRIVAFNKKRFHCGTKPSIIWVADSNIQGGVHNGTKRLYHKTKEMETTYGKRSVQN